MVGGGSFPEKKLTFVAPQGLRGATFGATFVMQELTTPER